jgi:hypothetical protein
MQSIHRSRGVGDVTDLTTRSSDPQSGARRRGGNRANHRTERGGSPPGSSPLRLHRRRGRSDRGATLTEAALVYPILFIALFGIVEVGLAFKDYLSVSHAARDGARAGATFGNDPRADILILRDVQATLVGIGLTEGIEVRIFDPVGGAGTTYDYQAGYGDGCDWNPCPDPDKPSPPYAVPAWDPAARDIEAPFTDRLAVEVEFQHNWVTNFFADTTEFRVEADFQIEPQVFEP